MSSSDWFKNLDLKGNKVKTSIGYITGSRFQKGSFIEKFTNLLVLKNKTRNCHRKYSNTDCVYWQKTVKPEINSPPIYKYLNVDVVEVGWGEGAGENDPFSQLYTCFRCDTNRHLTEGMHTYAKKPLYSRCHSLRKTFILWMIINCFNFADWVSLLVSSLKHIRTSSFFLFSVLDI